MTLLETITTLEELASQYPNINSIVKSGDIFDLSKEEYEQNYSVFCTTQRIHQIRNDFITYNFTLFYVDRLTLDKSNMIEIQSTATNFFSWLIKNIYENFTFIDISYGEVTPFNQRFSAECAGAYMDISLTVQQQSLCIDDYYN